MPAGVRSQAFTRRSFVQTSWTAVQPCAANLTRDRQGQEPMAKCGCALWRALAILWNEGNELLHRPLWNQQGTW